MTAMSDAFWKESSTSTQVRSCSRDMTDLKLVGGTIAGGLKAPGSRTSMRKVPKKVVATSAPAPRTITRRPVAWGLTCSAVGPSTVTGGSQVRAWSAGLGC